MAKSIVFRGKEKGDIAYYTAKTLASNNFTVAVIDNSFSKDLFESVHQFKDDESFHVEKENIVYIQDAILTDDFKDKFDYIVLYYGVNPYYVEADYTILISDYTNTGINSVNKMMNLVSGDTYFLLRDKVNKQIKEKNILETINIGEKNLIGYIPLDLKDEIGFQNLTYSGRQRIKDLSEPMQYAVMTIVAIATGDDLKTVKNYYRKAKRNMHF